MNNELIPDYGDDVPVIDDAEPEDAAPEHISQEEVEKALEEEGDEE